MRKLFIIIASLAFFSVAFAQSALDTPTALDNGWYKAKLTCEENSDAKELWVEVRDNTVTYLGKDKKNVKESNLLFNKNLSMPPFVEEQGGKTTATLAYADEMPCNIEITK